MEKNDKKLDNNLLDDNTLEENQPQFIIEGDDPELENEEVEIETPKYDDDLNTSLTEDEVNDLDVEEIEILMQKIDVELEEYENLFLAGQNAGKTYEEIVEDGYNDDEYNRLKALNKKLLKNKKALMKAKKESGFFSNVPTFGAVMFIVILLLTIIPVVPFLPFEITVLLANIIGSITSNSKAAFILTAILYDIILLLIEAIYVIRLYKKGKDSIDKFRNFKSMLVLAIVNLVIAIPGIIMVFVYVGWN